MTTPRPDPRLGTELGPYRFEAVIGHGGMGVVYLATHTGLDRRVALKLLSPDYADEESFRARFLRESKLAASIDHPNIIPIYDAGEIEGTYYLAMRYVEGTDLERRLREGPLEPREAVHLLAQVASALDAANEAGLVHRDVKPANILVASGKSVDRADHAYLTDFGLTKHRGSQTGLTRAGAFIGTLEYIAPEQIEGKPVDGRVDQYALAAIAVACLIGEPPFPRDSDVAIINAHLRDVPPSLHERRPEVPAAVDAVIARGLAKKPEDRYPDCKAFVDDLRSSLGVTATHERQRPMAGGRRGIPLIIGGSIVALAVLAAGFVWLGSGGAAPSDSPPSTSPSTGAGVVGQSSPFPTTSPTLGTYPNEAEATLLAILPDSLHETCQRGTYELVETDGSKPDAPLASLACSPPGSGGADEARVRQFRNTGVAYPFDFTVDSALSVIVERLQLTEGDCATSKRAIGPWFVSGEEVGKLLCASRGAGTPAVLYWTYSDDAILVMAVNKSGDADALYDFFERTARFITP